MKKLLLISYFYPPLGGPGVQRPVKLVKYLRKYGWQTDVITVKDIVFHSYDEELAIEDVANSVIRTVSLDPMSMLKKFSKNRSSKRSNIYFGTSEKIKRQIRNLFPIDEKIGWLLPAYRAGEKLLKSQKYDAIMATIGPYTSAIIAYKLSKNFSIPLIIDYRDHWTLNPYLESRTKFNKILSKKWESKILKQASVVTTIGQAMRNEMIEYFGLELESKTKVMYNGFDESDFEEIEFKKNDQIIIRYLGNFYGHRTPKYFIKALENLNNVGKIPGNIKIEFIGNYYQESRKYLTNNSVSEFISIHDQVDHKEAIKLLMNCDAVLLFIAASTGKGIITGKIFEYLRSEKPIMAMIPTDGEASKLLREKDQNNICAMEDVSSIEENVLRIFHELRNQKQINHKKPVEFSRENQTRQFVEFMENTI